MDEHEAYKRIEALKKEITVHRSNYHTHNTETLSEGALDTLKHELAMLEEQYPELVTSDSPTQRVGGDVLDGFIKHTHTVPMMSLGDVFAEDELADWMRRNTSFLGREGGNIEYFAELKLDGLAVSLGYQDFQLSFGATRGNGVVGETVTHNVKTIHDIPLALPVLDPGQVAELNRIRSGWGDTVAHLWNGTLEVRGEVYVRQSDFEKVNNDMLHQGKAPFANTRNLAAGSLRQLDSSIAAARRLSFFAWSLVTDFGQKSQYEEWRLLQVFGFPVVAEICQGKEVTDFAAFHQQMYSKRSQIDFAYDGLVIKVNNKDLQQQLGFVGKGPRFMIAYKFEAEEATTQIQDIRVQVGRTGKVTPVAILEPVHVYGVTVTHATLHNQDEIDRLEVKIGDTVVVRRAGDVIPEIVRVLPGLRVGTEQDFVFPSECPVCHTPLHQKDGQVNRICPNLQCPARTLRHLSYFVSKQAFDIRGLSEKLLEKLENAGLVQNELDILNLSYDELRILPGMGDLSAQNIISAIESSKHISFARFIQALGIPYVGEQTAKSLARVFPSIQAFMDASYEDFEAIDDIGEIVAQALIDYFAQESSQTKIQGFLDSGVTIKYPEVQISAGFFAGKTVVITGSFDEYSRSDITARIEAQGGKVSSSVSAKTDYVIAGAEAGSKREKAQKLGVPILEGQAALEVL